MTTGHIIMTNGNPVEAPYFINVKPGVQHLVWDGDAGNILGCKERCLTQSSATALSGAVSGLFSTQV